jgi:hypothetical protein
MKAENKKKVATIKSKVFSAMFSKAAENDKDYADAIDMLGKALQAIEKKYGSMD